MKRAVLLSVVLAFAGSAILGAQGKTSFSGTWTLDRAKSDPAPGRASGQEQTIVNTALAALTTLRMSQSATELRIEQIGRNNQPVIYKLTGDSVNEVPNGASKTKASWDGARLVLASTLSLSSDEGLAASNSSALEQYTGRRVDIQVKEIWSVNNAVLTIQRTATTPTGSRARKLVYARQP